MIHSVTPQGWAFFTRNPRDSWTHLWMDVGGKLEPANPADYRGGPWAGVKRALRNRGIALLGLSKQVTESDWSE